MIKVVLLDLDDTLITSNTLPMFYAYVNLLKEYVAETGIGQSDEFVEQVMSSYDKALRAYNPVKSLHNRFTSDFSP